MTAVGDECLARVFVVGDSTMAFVCRRKKGNHLIHAAVLDVEIVEQGRIERPIKATVTWQDAKDFTQEGKATV